MKKGFIMMTLLGVVGFVQNAYAVCTLNGEVVPCDQMPKWPFVMMLVFFVFMMLLLAFWVWMLVDIIKNEKENMALWLIILFLGSFLGAIIYYFVRKRGRKSTQNTQMQNETQNQNSVSEE